MKRLAEFEEHCNLVNLDDFRRQKALNKIIDGFENMDHQAGDVTDSYWELMKQDSSSALTQLPNFLDRVRNINTDRAFVESIAGGPNPDWTTPLLNIVGTIYPFLNQKDRATALHPILGYLDGLNYFYSQNHLAIMDEPWLIADIIFNRSIYNPGYAEYENLLKEYKTWAEFYPHIQQPKSAFWLAYSITRSQPVSEEIKTNFYNLYPSLIDRTQDAIAVFVNSDANYDKNKEGITLEQGIERWLFLCDKSLHPGIRRKITEQKWVDLR